MKTNNTIINSIMRTYMKYICAVVLLIGMNMNAWGTVTQYAFITNANFATSGGGWTCDIAGNSYTYGGVQCNNSHKGKAHTNSSFSDVTTIIVYYRADGTSGTIKAKVGDNSEQSYSLVNSGTGTNTCAVFDYLTAQSGVISIQGNSTGSNIYIGGVVIVHGTPTCNAINVTSEIILPAGNATYVNQAWYDHGLTATGYSIPNLYTTGSSSNYCAIVNQAYDLKTAVGLQFQKYGGLLLIHGISSSGGVVVEVDCSASSADKGFTIELTGATPLTGQYTGKPTIETTSTNATLVIRKPTDGSGGVKTIKITPKCEAPTLTLSPSSKTMTFGDNSNTYTITPTTNSSGTISWQSSDNTVATVAGGVVSVLKAGTATISCTVAAQGDYCEKTVEHELTVNPACPTLAKGTDAKALTAGSITSTSATLSGGIVTYKGGADLTAYGFVYGTSANPTTSNSVTNVGVNIAENTAFGSKSITSLTPNTTYYVRVYGTNGCGTRYSPDGTSGYITFTTLQRYTISYNSNGGGGTITDQYKDHGATATLNSGSNFSLTGYELTGWNTADDGSGSGYDLGGSYTANANATMYAVWSPQDYTITLDNQGATSAGTESIEVTFDANTNLTGSPAITLPTRTGYTFKGYFTGENGSGVQIIDEDGVVIASANDGGSNTYTDASKNWKYANDITLYADWTANTISLTLNKNCASGSDGSATITFDGTALNATPTHATNSDGTYSLYGYYAEAGLTNKILDASGNVVDATVSEYITDGKWTRATTPTTLYARWSKDMFTVTFNMNGHGDQVASQEVESGEKAVDPGTSDIVDWHFLGWFTDPSSGSQWVFNTNTVSGATTLYAHWEATSYNTGTYKAWCEPNISFSGDIHLTSVNGVQVYSTSTTGNLLHIISDDLSGVEKLEISYLDADNGDAVVANASSLFRLCNDGTENYNTADGTQIDVSGSNTCDLTYSIRYTPEEYGVINHYKLQVAMKRGSGVAVRTLKTATYDLYGRSLPEEFVVASKFGNEWYALPNTLEAIEKEAKAVAGIRITVDNNTTPEEALYAPTSTVYQGEGRYAANSHRYGIRLTNGTNHLQVSSTGSNNKMWLSPTGSSDNQDWWLSSTNFGAYSVTIPSNTGNETKKIGMYGGNIGYFASPTAPSGQIYFLPIRNKLIDVPASVTEWGQKSVILDVDAQTASSAQARFGSGSNEEASSFGQTLTSVKSAASKYNYTLTFSTTDFTSKEGQLLYIDWLDSEDEIIGTSTLTMPYIIASDGVMHTLDGTKGNWTNRVVHVLSGVTLTADAGGFSGSAVTIGTLEIYPGATVNVTTGTLTATNLMLRNGWTRAGGKEYDVARLYITPPDAEAEPAVAGANLIATNAYADWYIDYDQYYPIAVPWAVTTSGMTYLNSTNAASAGVKMKYYDGEGRANGTNGSAAEGMNWRDYSPLPATLSPSMAYAMTARRPTGKAFSIVRMPLTIPSASWTALGEQGEVSEVHKDQVEVTAYAKIDGSTPSYAQGWNFIANPYMALHLGALNYTSGGSIEYATVPDIYFREYDQKPIATTKLKPASGFLVQVPKDGTVTFGTTNRKPSAPSYRKEEQEDTTQDQKAYIVLSNDDAEDMMGILVADRFTEAYETNADLQKLLGDGTSLKTYMLYGDMNMAYVAINSALAQEWIPVTVRIPSTGEYTFSMHEASVADELEGVYLIDYANGNQVTNLINENYSFTTAEGTISGRFAINAIIGERQTPTDVDIIGADKDSKEPIKFLYHEKVYIYHHGVIYDATGKKVREINK